MAAVLSCGPGALLSHRSAAALWGLGFDARSRNEVTVVGRGGRGRPDLALHHVRAFDPRDRTLRDGIPLTTIPRTLLDLAEVVGMHQLERVFAEVDRSRLLDVVAIERL